MDWLNRPQTSQVQATGRGQRAGRGIIYCQDEAFQTRHTEDRTRTEGEGGLYAQLRGRSQLDTGGKHQSDEPERERR